MPCYIEQEAKRVPAQLILRCVTMALIAACGGGTTDPAVEVAQISLSPPQATVQQGGSQQFSATARTAGGQAVPNVSFVWSVTSLTSGVTVATVNQSGLATGTSLGEAQVFAASGGVSGSATLIVTAPPSGTWASRAPMPNPRQEMHAAVLQGRIVVPGGLTPTLQVTAITEAYDPATNAWTTVPAMPAARHHHGVAEAGGKLYLVGGYSNLAPPFWQVRAELFIYDPTSNTWTGGPSMPQARGAVAVAAHGGRIYVFGGAAQQQSFTNTYIFDPATNTWTTGAPMPTAREHHGAVTIGNRIYVVGGRVEAPSVVNYSVLEIYDPITNSWSVGAPMQIARSGITAVELDGRMLVFGGEVPGGGLFALAEEYDPVSDSWRSVRELPSPRTGAAGAAVGGVAYVIGGGGPGVTPAGPNLAFIP